VAPSWIERFNDVVRELQVDGVSSTCALIRRTGRAGERALRVGPAAVAVAVMPYRSG
jgi:hypothetical protein